MLLKKLLLELGTLAGLVGGVAGGLASSSQKSIEFNDVDETTFLSENSSTLVQNQKVNTDLKKRNSLISHLNYNVLNYWRWQSEGVGANFLFINGWEKAGKPIEINSETHSQKKRELWGGRLITFSNYDGGWFGPRDLTKMWKDLEKSKEITKGKSYWTMIQESKNYLKQKDWEELTRFWSDRSKELEEDIFGLWKGRDYWAKQFGVKQGGKVDLEFRLTNLSKFLEASEDDLRTQGWKYGELVSNSLLDGIRYFGDLEGTVFNYLRKIAWPNDENTKKLKERNVAKVIEKLIHGEEMGFNCNRDDDNEIKKKYFEECEKGAKEKLGKFEVVSVLKATNYSSGYRVPLKGKKAPWKEHPSLTADEKKLINFDKIEDSTLIFEKCEESGWILFLDANKQIRQEACERLLNPWFGDSVPDKRLCLFKSLENDYLLRLINYVKVVTIPTWHHKNTFWTKCSNFGI
ncbi:hypothetical protein OVS_01980 [Mycoplasma ovis str. Michigan]|uniref:Uncharacterized protein n=1 Tax=Mycoplasma ovis str. Michigan TaxID=1415773 RepID=A0ABM5P0J5_9MOLU|nr:hypothetical protein [Mycoplasma ovis]AHC39938.1 hypothetical protein OVS_01980 [Mycoplasma ovis str. Michigan]